MALDNLIYDRTIDNVQTIKDLSKIRYQDMTTEQRQSWIDNIKKGCYTYVDLNRVEDAVAYLDDRLKKSGISCDIELGKTWLKDDIPTIQDMQRYINNIINIRKLNIVLDTTPPSPERVNIDYIEANNIERILHDVDLMLVELTQQYLYSGEFYSGGDFL